MRTAGLRGAPQPFRFYQSPEGHSCVRKAVELLGFGSDAIRTVPSGADYRMDPARSIGRSPRISRQESDR